MDNVSGLEKILILGAFFRVVSGSDHSKQDSGAVLVFPVHLCSLDPDLNLGICNSTEWIFILGLVSVTLYE